MNTERSITALRTFDDAWIEQWAVVYLDAHLNRVLRAHGVRFETFLLSPVEILASIGRLPAVRTGLAPAQRAVQERLDVQDAMNTLADRALAEAARNGGHVENGRVVEKLRHRVWPRNPKHQIYRASPHGKAA